MIDWSSAASLGPARFADHFFDRDANDPIVAKLRDAANKAATARNHDELRAASTDLADARKAVGLDSRSRFVADAKQRADQPLQVTMTVAHVRKTYPLPGKVTLAGGSEEEAVPGAATRMLRGLQEQTTGKIAATQQALTPADLGLKESLVNELKGTFTIVRQTATVHIDMIDVAPTSLPRMIQSLSNLAREQGATVLRLEGTIANPRLLDMAV